MGNTQYNSTALCLEEKIDCRYLQLEAHFYSLLPEQVEQLVADYVAFSKDITDGAFIVKWSGETRCDFSGKVAKGTLQSLAEGAYATLGFEAYAISSLVYNSATYKAFQRERMYPTRPPKVWYDLTTIFCSSSYRELFESNLSRMKRDPQSLRAVIYELHQIENFYFENYILTTDALSSLHCQPITTGGEYNRCGKLRVMISTHCLGDSLNQMAETFKVFARSLSDKYTTINAYVCLSPALLLQPASPHMIYFGKNIPVADKGESSARPREWYTRDYLCGAEWVNVISPNVRKLLPHNGANLHSNTYISVEETGNGALCVSLNKAIGSITVADIRRIKTMLYPALCPGSAVFEDQYLYSSEWWTPNTKPRCQWEMIPLFESEIQVRDGNLIFEHSSKDVVSTVSLDNN